MRSTWRGYHYGPTTGVFPGGGSHPWVTALADGVIVHRGRAWAFQRGRPAYLGRPLGLFVPTTPGGRPVRAKFAGVARRKRR